MDLWNEMNITDEKKEECLQKYIEHEQKINPQKTKMEIEKEFNQAWEYIGKLDNDGVLLLGILVAILDVNDTPPRGD